MHNILVFSVISTLIQPAYAIDLNTKFKNTDRSQFNTNPGTTIKDGYGMIFSEFNFSANPMVIRNKNTGEIEPLVSSLMGLDVGVNYGLTSWMQVGMLLPFEKVDGENSKNYLSGPYFEAKFKVLNNYALVPFYQLGSSNKINVDIGGSQSVNMGSPSGMYGAKMVGQWGNVLESWGLAAQVGYVVSPDNQFLTIDQSSRIMMGASAGMPLTEKINGVVEVSAEKMDSNFPIEVLGLVNVKNDDINFQVGAGSGNIQGSGSNTFKAFVGVTMFFGGPAKKQSLLPVYRSNPKQNFPQNNRNNNEPIKPLMEDGFDEQQGPEVLEPGQSQDPVIPDVNGNNMDNFYGRNLASENMDPEIMNALIDSEEANEVKEEDPLLDLVEPRAKKFKVEKNVLQQAQDKTKTVLKKKLAEDTQKSAIPLVEVKQDKLPVKKVEAKVAPVKVETKVAEKLPVKKEVAPAQKVEVKVVEKTEVKKVEATPVTVEKKVVEEKVEVKKVVKKAVKPVVAKDQGRMDKLPNGQKVKVFTKEITQMPSEVGVVYMTEEGFKETVAKMKAELAEGGKLAKPVTPKVSENLIKAPVTTLEEVKPTPISVETAPIKEKDPVVMIPEHVDNSLANQGTELEIVPVDVTKLGKKKEEEKTVEATPIKVETAKEEVKTISGDTVDLDIPKVQVSVEQREELKKKLTQEFNSISLEEGRKNLSDKVLQEQAKINEQILEKQTAEAEAKAKQEAEALAIKQAAEEKDLRENAPLAESKEATPGVAATKDELRPVQILNKRSQRPVIISLPQARLDAFAAGEKMPTMKVNSEATAKALNLLEEDSDIEEASGPSYGFGEE